VLKHFRRVVLVGCSAGASCGPETEEPIEPTYANVAATIENSCALSSSCHGGTGRGKARLNFDDAFNQGRPITELLNGVLACEYDRLPRVDPGHPERSWLMIKLDGMYGADGTIHFEPASDWDPCIGPNMVCPDAMGRYPSSTCPLTEDGRLSFGVVMPQILGSPSPLSRVQIEMFRQWIEMGAPGPEGSAGDAGPDAD